MNKLLEMRSWRGRGSSSTCATSTRTSTRGTINHVHLQLERGMCRSVGIMTRLDPLPSCYLFTGCVLSKVFTQGPNCVTKQYLFSYYKNIKLQQIFGWIWWP